MKIRMKFLVLVLVSALLAGLLSGCGSTTQQTAAEDSQREDNDIISDAINVSGDSAVTTFGLAYQSEFGLNPYSCTNLTNRTIQSLLYESLFTVTSNFEIEPVLCQTYDVSEDLKTYTIHLIDGVSFSDGTPLTAADVVASYEAARGSEVYGNRFYSLYSVSAQDEDTVVFIMSRPYENLLLLLDVPIAKSGTTGSSTPVGTGPYCLVADSSTSILMRNSNWWRDAYDAAVTVTTITLVETDTPTDVRDDFEYGVTGVVCTDPNSAAYVDYHCDFELWNCATTIMDYIGFNVSSGLFSLTQLRAALTYIVDRDAIATELYRGYGEPAVLPASPRSSFYDTELAAQYAYDPARFQEAVKQTQARGSSAVFLVCNTDPRRVEAAEYIAAEAAKYGIELTVDSVNESTFKARVVSGNYDLYFGEVRLSPTFDLSAFFNGGTLCFGGIYSGDLTQLSYNALENSGNYYDLHASIMTYGMFCPVLFKSYAVYATRGVISNMYPAIDNIFHTSNGRTLSDAILGTPNEVPGDETGEELPSESGEAGEEVPTGEEAADIGSFDPEDADEAPAEQPPDA